MLHTLSEYCDEFLVHGVDVEGKMCGIESELVQLLGLHSPVPVTYAGGVRSIDDLELVKSLGSNKVNQLYMNNIILVKSLVSNKVNQLCNYV